MAQHTNVDSARKAAELTKPLEEEKKKKRTYLFSNAATYISIFVIVLSVVLYSYNKGYSSVYCIPVNTIPIDVKRYIPVAVQVLGVTTWILYYVSTVQQERTLKKRKYNLLRVMYGYTVLSVLMTYNNIDQFLGTIWRIAIPLVVSVVTELALFYLHKPKKSKAIDEITYKIRTEDYVFDRILSTYLGRYGIGVLVIAVILAQPVGRLSARAKCDYQIFTCDYKTYAVIVEYDDKVLAQEIIENEDTLSIDVSSYKYIEKNGLKLIYKKYENVVFTDL